MRQLYIDLTKLNPKYPGGATRFAQGLAAALPEASRLFPGDRPALGSIVIAPQCRVNFPECKTILCIHDVQHEVHPENFSLPRRVWRKYQYRRACRAAWKIQVSSYAIWRDLQKYMGLDSDKFFLAPEGYDEKLWSPGLPDEKPFINVGFPERFVYYPAGLWKHKNHATVIEGLKGSGISLVLTGQNYGELETVQTLAGKAGVDLWTLGIIPEAQMRWLYKNAICTIAAGYYESGSLPLKEALACNGKVLAANIEPNTVLKGLPNLWHFETLSPSSFAEQLESVRTSNRAGWRNIEEFRWSKIADIYRNVANG